MASTTSKSFTMPRRGNNGRAWNWFRAVANIIPAGEGPASVLAVRQVVKSPNNRQYGKYQPPTPTLKPALRASLKMVGSAVRGSPGAWRGTHHSRDTLE